MKMKLPINIRHGLHFTFDGNLLSLWDTKSEAQFTLQLTEQQKRIIATEYAKVECEGCGKNVPTNDNGLCKRCQRMASQSTNH